MVARVVTGPAIAPHGSADRCPGALHAVAADDGALARVRVPGGYLGIAALDALADVAERFGDGSLDITARANVQLRGLREGDLANVAATISAAGLLPSEAHERVRNIVASPYAGLDPSEAADVRPFVADLDRALCADATLAALPPKFLVAFDGGGFDIDVRGADLTARAYRSRFIIAIAGETRRLDITAGDVVATLCALARHALEVANASGVEAGTWRLQTLPSHVDRIAASLARFVAHARKDDPMLESGGSVAARKPMPTLGIVETCDPAYVALAPSIPLARLSVAQARTLARLARECDASIRLAPWRGVVLGAVARCDLAYVRAELLAADMPLDASDGFAGVAACAGRGACDAALADVRADATAYAKQVAHAVTDGAREPRYINLAGCSKRCAMRRGADADLVATANGYDVFLRGTLAATSLSPAAALALVASANA